MNLDIIKYPDKRLSGISLPIQIINPEIKILANNMIETMYNNNGVGLAAPQIGQMIRMFVMDDRANEEIRNPRVIINPELEFFGNKIKSIKEGCLSVPMDFRSDVARYEMVKLKFQDENGNQIDEVFSGFPAIIIQHETDHLDGKLFIDRISNLKRSMYDAKVKKWIKHINPK